MRQPDPHPQGHACAAQALVRDPSARDAAPSATHLLGTDRFGFDMLAQVLRSAFPGLVLALAAVALLGPDLRNVVLVMTLLLWPGTARLIRSRVLSVRSWPFVDAARALGAGSWRLAPRHVLPQVVGTAFTAATLTTAGAILIEANLSFLGLSDPTLPSLGKLLSSAQSQQVLATRWWLWIPPGVTLVTLILGLHLLGDGLRDLLSQR